MNKKFLMIVMVGIGFFMVNNVYALEGSLPDYPRTKLWRSTMTDVDLGTIIFATAPIVIHNIVVSSPSTNVSECHVFDSTSTADIHFSTVAYRNGSIPAQTWEGNDTPFDVTVTSTPVIRRTGNARWTILWDWASGFSMGLFPR